MCKAYALCGDVGWRPSPRSRDYNELIGEQIDWIDVHVDIDPEKSTIKVYGVCRHSDGQRRHFRIEPERSDAFQATIHENNGRLVRSFISVKPLDLFGE